MIVRMSGQLTCLAWKALVGALLVSASVMAHAHPVPLNASSVEELAAIDGVDDALAEVVVAMRTERGRLGSVEELRAHPEVSPDALDALRGGTSVDIQLPMGEARTPGEVGDVLERFDHEPTINQVQRWANSYAQTSPEQVTRWMTASRTFALLPRFRVQYRGREAWTQNWNFFPVDGIVEPGADVFDALDGARRNQDYQYTLQATWDLADLVMSSERIRVISQGQSTVRLRDRVLGEVTRTYFERRRHQVEMLLSPKADIQGQVEDELRLLELTAHLDALTGGQFSRGLR